MIEILVAPGQVRSVRMLGRAQIVRDLDLDAYHVILPLIDEMDRRLRSRCDGVGREPLDSVMPVE